MLVAMLVVCCLVLLVFDGCWYQHQHHCQQQQHIILDANANIGVDDYHDDYDDDADDDDDDIHHLHGHYVSYDFNDYAHFVVIINAFIKKSFIFMFIV